MPGRGRPVKKKGNARGAHVSDLESDALAAVIAAGGAEADSVAPPAAAIAAVEGAVEAINGIQSCAEAKAEGPIATGAAYVKWSALVLYDAWFGSVKAAVAHGKRGVHFIAGVKTGHKLFPKLYLEAMLDPLPGGSKLAMSMTLDGVDLVAVGYKYNSKKVLFFIMTRGAGSTANGSSYFARFQDQHGNVTGRDVDRPAAISRYFEYSPVVDNHNQIRQHEIGVEQTWVTHNCWFRLFCTMVGIVATDVVYGSRMSVHPGHALASMPSWKVVTRLAYQLTHNNHASKPRATAEAQAKSKSKSKRSRTEASSAGFTAANFASVVHESARFPTKSVIATKESQCVKSGKKKVGELYEVWQQITCSVCGQESRKRTMWCCNAPQCTVPVRGGGGLMRPVAVCRLECMAKHRILMEQV